MLLYLRVAPSPRTAPWGLLSENINVKRAEVFFNREATKSQRGPHHQAPASGRVTLSKLTVGTKESPHETATVHPGETGRMVKGWTPRGPRCSSFFGCIRPAAGSEHHHYEVQHPRSRPRPVYLCEGNS